MSSESESDSISRLVESTVGLSVAALRALPDGAIEQLRVRRRQAREFENAVKDFITIVLTTPLVQPGEELLRVELAKIPQMMWAREWETAIHATDEEFRKARLGLPEHASEVLKLLRATRRAESEMEDARMFMLHGRSHPTRYSDPKHQEAFGRIVELMREAVHSEVGSQGRRAESQLPQEILEADKPKKWWKFWPRKTADNR